MRHAAHDFPISTVGGVPFAAAGLDEATRWLTDAAAGRQAISVRLANAYCVALASRDAEYASTLSQDGVNFADGTPVAAIVAASRRWRRRPTAYLVRGPSLFTRLVTEGRMRGYFVGSTDRTLNGIVARLTDAGLAHTIAGHYAPPFAPLSPAIVDDIVERILPTDPDIVWVGMGTPKQDFLTTEIARRLNRPCVGVGAAFDFYSGTQPEAPSWIQGSGLEWVHRLIREPRRLALRYTVGNIRFVQAVVKGKL